MISYINEAGALKLYRALVRARKFDEKVGELYPQQEIKCPVHLSLGEEGSAAGVCAALETRDKVWAGHRCHGPAVAKGADLKPLFAELYGKVTGCSRGKGGSMHFVAPEVGVMGASAIIGGSVPLSLGSALAAKLCGDDFVSAVFFGDGGVEQGTFHESLNFASLHKLPVIFVMTNNNLSTITPLSKRQANLELWQHAAAYNIPGFRLDGRRPQEVFEAAKLAVARARKGEGPTLIEVMAERWAVHVLTNAGYEPAGAQDDPVENFKQFALSEKLANETQLKEIGDQVTEEIDQALIFAKESPFPPIEEMYLHV